MKAKEWASFLLHRFALRMAGAVALATAIWLVLPRAVMAKAKDRAREAGYEMTAEKAVLRPWRVELLRVRMMGPKADVKADKITVAYDGRLRTGPITVDGADVTLKEHEKRTAERGKRTEITLTNSKVRVTRGATSATAMVRSARLGANGHIWADADVTAGQGRFSVEAKGMKAEDVDPDGPVELSAESIRVNVEERAGNTIQEGGQDRPERKKVTVRAKSVRIEGTQTAEADNVLASLESFPWGQEVHVEAGRVAAEGYSAEMVAADVTRKKNGPRRLDVEASAESVETENRRLSKGEFSIKKMKVRGSASKTSLGDWIVNGDVRVGEAQTNVSASLGTEGASLKIEMREIGCQALLESLPRELVPVLRPENGETKLSGTIAWRLEMTVDLPARKKPDVSIWLRNKCVVDKVPDEINIRRLQRPFRHEEYSASGKMTTEIVGPGTANWTPLGAVSPLMPMAVMAMEDPSFMAHRGVLIEAIENSMEQNITAGKFLRGGSTISMQLAKNLWLAREKTLSRKIQEAFLTTYLEQRMTKQKMIELYLNVVEFGPDLYGIGPAARKYFAKDPGSLTLSQSLFLASLLPSPKSAGYEEGKKVSQGRLGLLRKVMKMMFDRGTIDRTQYEQGLRETPVFGEPSAVGEVDVGPRVPGGIDPSEWR